MTKEDKDLLLKDLSARLPYGVKIDKVLYGSITLDERHIESFRKGYDDILIPYLRTMSSMTEDEKEELKSKCIHTETEEDWEGVRCDVWGIQILDKYDTERWDNPIWASTINMDAIDWLNAHHFDFRNLIERGMAIEVTEENNPYKDKL